MDLPDGERNLKSRTCFLFGISVNMCICCFQAGFAIGGNNVVGEILADQLNWGDKADMYNTIISSSSIAGITIGSLAAGQICGIGRRKAILYSNIVVFLSTGMMLVLNLWVISVARFIQAFAAGVIMCASNLYLAETIPPKLRTKYGIVVNLGGVIGLLITSLMGLLLPESGTAEAKTTQLWRVSVGIGLITCVITSFIFLCIYKRESLKFIV